MSTLANIIIFTLVGSIFSLIGGFLLLLKGKKTEHVVHVLVSFAAGALLGTAFVELLPEAVEHAEEFGIATPMYFFVLLGILGFYLLDRVIHWFHYHRVEKKKHSEHARPTVPLVIVSDSVHNFIDGIAIAITFMVNPALGVVTTLAVAAHEIPQEIGDFAILLHEGMSRKKVILVNIASALLALLGALLAYAIGEQVEAILPYALALTAGFFIYIALTSLIPEIHHEEKKGYAFAETFFLLLGALVIFGAVTFLGPHGH